MRDGGFSLLEVLAALVILAWIAVVLLEHRADAANDLARRAHEARLLEFAAFVERARTLGLDPHPRLARAGIRGRELPEVGADGRLRRRLRLEDGRGALEILLPGEVRP